MTIGDFLYQASAWQWIGVILLICALASFKPLVIKNYYTKKDEK